MAEAVAMSLKEADRYAVIVQVIERTMAQADAAAWLNVSVRQVKRLVRRIRQDGPTPYSQKTIGGDFRKNNSIALTANSNCRPNCQTKTANFGAPIAA